MRKKRDTVLLVFLPLILLAAILYLLPPIRTRVDWRIEQLRLQLKYALFPPEQAVFTPQDQVAAAVQATFRALTPQVTATPTLTATPTPGPTRPPLPTYTPTLAPTPIPAAVSLKGVRYIDQHGAYNYCAPANLAMGLSFWGWKGTRADTGLVLKPFDKDLNVMPYEMVDYVLEKTEYKALWRDGGTPDLVKKLLAAGYPVILEKGAIMQDLTGKMSWMGHYEVFTGYDNVKEEFITQDSFYRPNFPVSYLELNSEWRSFNNVFILIYPPEKEDAVKSLLGDYWDDTMANRIAFNQAEADLKTQAGVDLYFAWFNRGTSQVNLKDFAGAAASYDQAFKLYEGLPAASRPWRMLWYQTGPYFAYYYAGRYQDLLNLSALTIDTATNPYIEESFYWRALGELMVGKQTEAIQDLKTALEYHPGFLPATQQLEKLGVAP
jgi:hypothetical protein